MKKYFKIANGSVVPTSAEEAQINVYVSPDDREKRQILDFLKIDQYNLESSLDPDEISRIEYLPDLVSIIWKRPENASFEQQLRFDVSSLGIFMHADKLTIVMNNDAVPFSSKEFVGIVTLFDVLIKMLLHTIRHYLEHLKVVKQITIDLESKISTSMENRYLVQMFALSESLIYYQNAIEANGTVLSKLRSYAEKLGFTKPQTESLDDILLDNQQCTRQAQIYSSVLSGLMDARGNLINNNMNVFLKNLMLINIIFLPLNLIASIGGMSEYSMMTHGMGWRLSYLLFSLGMVVLGWVTWVILARGVDKSKRIERKRRSS